MECGLLDFNSKEERNNRMLSRTTGNEPDAAIGPRAYQWQHLVVVTGLPMLTTVDHQSWLHPIARHLSLLRPIAE